MKNKDFRLSSRIALITLIASIFMLGSAGSSFGQRPPRRPPRVEGQTPIGTINGQPVTANDLINSINTDSPFMPPLDGSPAPALQQFENQYPATPPVPSQSPNIPPQPTAPSFSAQIQNLMTTGQEWLFKSVLDTIIKPLMPILTFLAWIIASFVLILGFMRRFHEGKGIGPEQLVAWGTRTIIFMVIVGASPFIIDALTVTGKVLRPARQSHEQAANDRLR